MTDKAALVGYLIAIVMAVIGLSIFADSFIRPKAIEPKPIQFTNDGGAPFPVIGTQWSDWDWQLVIQKHSDLNIACVDPVTHEIGIMEYRAKFLSNDKLVCAYGVWSGNEMIAQAQDGIGPAQWHFLWCGRTVDPHEWYVLMRRWYAANLPKDICQQMH